LCFPVAIAIAINSIYSDARGNHWSEHIFVVVVVVAITITITITVTVTVTTVTITIVIIIGNWQLPGQKIIPRSNLMSCHVMSCHTPPTNIGIVRTSGKG